MEHEIISNLNVLFGIAPYYEGPWYDYRMKGRSFHYYNSNRFFLLNSPGRLPIDAYNGCIILRIL